MTKPDLTDENYSDLVTYLLDVADRLRKLALRAPDIAHELRRFADELEQEAVQARHGTEQKA
jgi:hypothetical protein